MEPNIEELGVGAFAKENPAVEKPPSDIYIIRHRPIAKTRV